MMGALPSRADGSASGRVGGPQEASGSNIRRVENGRWAIRATFWGVRGGIPVPGPATVEFGGNTTCLEVRAGPHLIIIDAGTGIIQLGAKLEAERARSGQPIAGTLLFTHGHHDHTQGLAHFAPLCFGDSYFHVLGPQVFGLDLREMLTRATRPSIYPTPLDHLENMRSIRTVYERQAIVLLQPGIEPVVKDLDLGEPSVPSGAVRICLYHSSHHPRGGVLIYRIEYRGRKLVFATDTEGYEGGDQRLIRLARGADLLIHDAEYTDQEYGGPPLARQGWGHSTWRMAVDVGQQAGAKQLALTHHHAGHDDACLRAIEREAQAIFPSAFVVREGTIIEL
jgi:phosphoribosyl 1,2-cyclic phosphodiesterase